MGMGSIGVPPVRKPGSHRRDADAPPPDTIAFF
jgi:hypothetical protein